MIMASEKQQQQQQQQQQTNQQQQQQQQHQQQKQAESKNGDFESEYYAGQNVKHNQHATLRSAKSLGLKLSNDIKELSNTALLSSIKLYEDNFANCSIHYNNYRTSKDNSIVGHKVKGSQLANNQNSKSMSSLLYLSSSKQPPGSSINLNNSIPTTGKKLVDIYDDSSLTTNDSWVKCKNNCQEHGTNIVANLLYAVGTTAEKLTDLGLKNNKPPPNTSEIMNVTPSMPNLFEHAMKIISLQQLHDNNEPISRAEKQQQQQPTGIVLDKNMSIVSAASTYYTAPTSSSSLISDVNVNGKHFNHSKPMKNMRKTEFFTSSNSMSSSSNNNSFGPSDPNVNPIRDENGDQEEKFTDSINNLSSSTSNTTTAIAKNMEKKTNKRFNLGLMGRTFRKQSGKKYAAHLNYFHTKSNNYQHQSQQTKKSKITTANSIIRNSSMKRFKQTDWSENTKQGTHSWSDVTNTQTNESCYLSDANALEFHKLNDCVKCVNQSKNCPKKRCNICKITVHESCIDLFQTFVKCRVTFREAINRKKSLKDKEQVTAGCLNSTINSHHWLCRKFDEESFENRCQACLKSFTNRFGLQSSRNIVSCSWCKASYHLKCFSHNQFKLECNFGEHNQLVVPPSWIVKSANKNSYRSSLINRSHHRSSKRFHAQQHQHDSVSSTNNAVVISKETSSPNENNNNNNNPPNSSNNNVSSTLLCPTSNQTCNQFQSSIRHRNRLFIIRPPACTSNQNLSLKKPLLVLINPKSGGKLGPKVLKKFTWLLNARQVFDLTLCGGPKLPLYLYRNVPNLRLLVGGGDGTVGWVLSVIDQIKFLASPPPVALLPLGTGNDLARSLNWGGGYTDEPLTKVLSKVLESRTVKLDRWKITTEPNLENIENGDYFEPDSTNTLKCDVMNNYFSLGADAHVCLEFHERREANPHKFTSRWFNLLQYIEAGGRDQIKKTWRDLKDYIRLECDGKNYTDIIKSRGYHCIIFLNIAKYSSGTNPWGNSTDPNFQPQAMNDGRLEVIGCFTSTLAKFHLGGNGERICQAKYVKLTTYTSIPIQIDGEPTKLNPSIIEIRHKNQSLMLEHVKFNTDSPILGYHSNIHKNFEVKCVLMEDYEDYRKNTTMLEKKAIYIGAICTYNLTDPLAKFRITIDLLIRNCANGFYTSKWSFLSGDEFYRVSDDSDECLLDIVSTDEIVYILDENPRNTNTTFNQNFKSSILNEARLRNLAKIANGTRENNLDADEDAMVDEEVAKLARRQHLKQHQNESFQQRRPPNYGNNDDADEDEQEDDDDDDDEEEDEGGRGDDEEPNSDQETRERKPQYDIEEDCGDEEDVFTRVNININKHGKKSATSRLVSSSNSFQTSKSAQTKRMPLF